MNLILDNIVFSLQKSGGISVVWYEMLKRVQKDINFKSCYIEFDDSFQNNFRKKLNIRKEAIILKRSLWLNIDRYLDQSLLQINDKFVFHSSYYRISSNKNAINITTVHDFTYEKLEHGLRKWIHCFQKSRAIKKSDVIICISENTKQDLLEYLPKTDVNKIRVIYNGVSEDYFPLDHNLEVDLPFPTKSYTLFVGSRKSHKQFNLAVDVVSKMGMNFVIVGGDDISNYELNLLESKVGINRFQYVGKISNNELNILYNNAFCLLYPSLYEGFGIPVIEAQRAGCPVVAFEGSSVKEIAGNTPLLFKEHTVDNITQYMSILYDKLTRREIINEGIKNASQFSWDNTYSHLISVYEEALNINK